MTRIFIAAAVLVCATVAWCAEDKPLQCTGSLIEPSGGAQTEKSLRLTLGSKVVLNLGQGDIKPWIVSDNKIQLKFRTKDFVGEFFHYTNDLFLIYRSGHLARMTCKPEG